MLRQILRDGAARESFLRDPAAFVQGADLNDDERRALAAKDYRALYLLGVHSFLLYAFVMKIFPGDPRKIDEEYRKTITPLGRIDYST
jgi:hypothetical protein